MFPRIDFVLCSVILCFSQVNSSHKLTIGGLYEDIELHKTAFFYETTVFNKEATKNDSVLDPLIFPKSKPNHAFSALLSFCSFLNESAVGIFGSQTSSNLEIVQTLSKKKQIPLILTRWIDNKPLGKFTLNFSPDPALLVQAYLDIVTFLEWDSFTVIYTDSASFLKIADFIKLTKDVDIPVYVENLDPYHTNNYRPLLRKLRESGETKFVIDCPIRHLKDLLSQIQQVGMLTRNYNYFLTNLDADTQDLEQFMYNEAVITGIHLLKPMEADAIGVLRELCHLYQVTFDDNCMSRVGKDFPELDVETALIMDAVQIYISVLKYANITGGRSIQCNSDDIWERGEEIYTLIKEGFYAGITGKIKFGENGYRNAFELVIFQIREKFSEKGFWNTTVGLNMTVEHVEILDLEDIMFNKNLLVEITLRQPFVMLRESSYELRGNERYEGFAIDLIDKISKLEGFKYTLVLRNDGKNGEFDKALGKWTGMIGDVLKGEVDMAISDLTITGERVGPVEFTQPFMDVGISILFHKPTEKPPSFFSFTQPFSTEFLQALGAAYLAVIISLFVIGRLSQADWKKEETYMYNQLTLKNSFWFVTGSLFRQNTQIRIKSLPARILVASWWLLCFVIVSLYIAYLMAHDTVTEKIHLFNNVEELVANAETHGIKFGALKGGATGSFFRRSSYSTYKEIAAYMEKHPEDMPTTAEEGIARAENENYAYFMESTSIEYITARHCHLTMVGGLLDTKAYGIALPKDSPYLTALNRAILKLGSSGELTDLKKTWWEDRNSGRGCDISDQEEVRPRDLAHVRGLIFVTLGGVVIAFLCSIIEFHKNVKRICKKQKLPYGKILGSELSRSFGSRTKKTTYVKKSNKDNRTVELL